MNDETERLTLVTIHYGSSKHTVVMVGDSKIAPDEDVVPSCLNSNGDPTVEVFRRGWDRVSLKVLS